MELGDEAAQKQTSMTWHLKIGHGRWTLMLAIPPEGLTRWILGPRTGPDGSGRTVRFIWTNFQAKRPVLDPFGAKLDALGASHNFGGDLTSPGLPQPNNFQLWGRRHSQLFG